MRLGVNSFDIFALQKTTIFLRTYTVARSLKTEPYAIFFIAAAH